MIINILLSTLLAITFAYNCIRLILQILEARSLGLETLDGGPLLYAVTSFGLLVGSIVFAIYESQNRVEEIKQKK